MFRICLAVCLLLGASSRPAFAVGSYDDLLKYLPASTNAIAFMDMKAALASPLAKRQNWGDKAQANNRDGLGFLATMGAEKIIIADDINLNTMVRNFQVALVKFHNAPDMNEIAAREGGTADEIAGCVSVLSPRDVYYVAISSSIVAAIYPADRQNTARWIRAAKSSKASPLTGYLKTAAEKAADSTVTIAVDLNDVVDRNILKLSLRASPTVVKNKNLDLGRLASFLASVKGMTFRANIDQAITASMTWEFGFDPTQARNTLPSLIFELVEGMGVTIPNLESWTPVFTDTTMTLSGSMTPQDLKRILSLFGFPSVNEEPADSPAKENQATAASTKRYLSAVDSILVDLGKLKDSPYYEKSATWIDKSASQIEHLSRQRVDPLAIDAAMKISKRLQAVGASLRGVPVDVNALASQAYAYTLPNNQVGFAGGWWGWRPYLSIGPSSVNTNIPQIQAAIAKVISDDEKQREGLWSEITRLMVETRRTLAEKYKVPF